MDSYGNEKSIKIRKLNHYIKLTSQLEKESDFVLVNSKKL